MSGPSGSARRIVRRLVRFLAGVVAVVIAGVALLVALMWRDHRTAIELPAPTGPFAVGRATFAWVNDRAIDRFAPAPGTPQQLVVWMWYPAIRSAADVPAEYLPPAWRTAVGQYQGALMRTLLKRDLSLVRVHSVADAPVSTERAAFPVVLMRPGGSAPTTDFTTLAEDLASHGYFVVGFDAPHRSSVVVLPDRSVVTRVDAANVENAEGDVNAPVVEELLAMWTTDATFVVDQLQRINADPSSRFAGRMDLERLGMFGHSFGGATALEFCRQDERCRAAIDLDGIPFGGVVTAGLAKPGMFLLSDHSSEMADPASREILARIQSVVDRLPAGRLLVVLRGSNHFSFSDQILVNSQTVIGLLRLAGFGRLDGRRGLAIATDYVHTFFDVQLNGGRSGSLSELAAKYPEVRVDAR